MDKRMLAVDGVFLMGLLFIVLGIIHCIAAPLMMRNNLGMMLPDESHATLYMILATGAATIFCGWILLFASKGMRLIQPWAWRLATRVTIFLCLMGLGAVVAMLSNPFAHLMLGMDIALIIILAQSAKLLRPDIRESWPK
jgi:hypothetical protein